MPNSIISDYLSIRARYRELYGDTWHQPSEEKKAYPWDRPDQQDYSSPFEKIAVEFDLADFLWRYPNGCRKGGLELGKALNCQWQYSNHNSNGGTCEMDIADWPCAKAGVCVYARP